MKENEYSDENQELLKLMQEQLNDFKKRAVLAKKELAEITQETLRIIRKINKINNKIKLDKE